MILLFEYGIQLFAVELFEHPSRKAVLIQHDAIFGEFADRLGSEYQPIADYTHCRLMLAVAAVSSRHTLDSFFHRPVDCHFWNFAWNSRQIVGGTW